MRGADWTDRTDWVGLVSRSGKLHRVYFNRYGVPLTVCKSHEVRHAAKNTELTPSMRDAEHCAGGCW